MIVRVGDGLGNQMFQYAFYLAIKNHYKGVDVKWDMGNCVKRPLHNGFELERIFGLKDYICDDKLHTFQDHFGFIMAFLNRRGKKTLRIANEYDEILLGYHEDVFKQKNKKLCFDGYWQSEDYFKDVKGQVRKAFEFPKITDEKNLSTLEQMRNSESVGIHVRRGNYLELSRYTNLGEIGYYDRALQYMNEHLSKPRYFIFSNDIEWCKKNLKVGSDAVFVTWNVDENSYIDMQLMSCCKHNIIANSTFSWWGAWLNKNPNKIVLAPKRFFTIDSMDESRMIPDEWIRL
ncbi:MAG: alpha-1,2-fucosyltransferase [Lachnospiraceae bacterium]|nr:alpha-1,2-fucosyltransferase [Lachnospiraceae bacterium]